MAGRKPIFINLKSTSPDGEVRFFRSIRDAARELGFSEHGLGRAYHDGRDRIGQYELECLEPDPVEEPKSKPRSKPRTSTGELKKKVEEKTNKSKEENVRGRTVLNCTFCGKELDGKDISDYFIMEELDSSGDSIDLRTYKSLYEASQDTKISSGAFQNARDKGNTLIVRRKDKVPFRISWSNIHPNCFKFKKEIERSEEREKERLEEASRKEALSKMNKEELVEFKRKEKDERSKKDMEFEKLFNRVFSRDTLHKSN